MEKIAIIGIGCLFPGAFSPEEYYNNLLDHKDMTTPLTVQETDGIDPNIYYSPIPGDIEKINYSHNGHLRGFIFDPTGYALPPDELNSLDNIYKWLVYTSAKALEDSGYRNHAAILEKTGLIAGNVGLPSYSTKRILGRLYHLGVEPYVQQLLHAPAFKFDRFWAHHDDNPLDLLLHGFNVTVAASALGLNGPSFAIDAACASSVYAIDLASYYLQSGKAELMLAGATCYGDHVFLDQGFSLLRVMPPDGGISAPLDRHSEGTKAGEGAGIVVLKRYSDAVRDGDKIYGIVESIGLSNDAGTKHLLVPDVNGQKIAFERAYEGRGDLDVDYVECHATGTPVGDQVELTSVAEFYLSRNNNKIPLIGANKGNTGHLLTVSGMSSIIKALMSMKYGVIPATINVTELIKSPDDAIQLSHLVRENTPWPMHNGPKRAGVNSFGFGGINAHIVLSEHSPQTEAIAPVAAPHYVFTPLAIVGLAINLEETDSVQLFNNVLYQTRQFIGDMPPIRWFGLGDNLAILAQGARVRPPQGSFICDLNIDSMRYKYPPNTITKSLRSHLLALQVAEAGYLDAGYPLDRNPKNIALIFASASETSYAQSQYRVELPWQLAQSLASSGLVLTDEELRQLETILKDSILETSHPEAVTAALYHIASSRIGAYLKLNGPVFALQTEEDSAYKSIEIAQFLLANHKVDAVMIVSGTQGASIEKVIYDHASRRSHDVADGASVIVLKREEVAEKENNKIYAVIESLNIVHANAPTLAHNVNEKAIEKAIKGSLALAGVSADAIDYIELAASGTEEDLSKEISVINAVYGQPTESKKPPITVGTFHANFGNVIGVSGLFNIVRSVVALSQHYIPGTPAYRNTGLIKQTLDASLQLSDISYYWDKPASGVRRAAINGYGIDRDYVHMIIREPNAAFRKTELSVLKINTPEIDNRLLNVNINFDSVKGLIMTDENRNYFADAAKRNRKNDTPSNEPSSRDDVPSAQTEQSHTLTSNEHPATPLHHVISNAQVHLRYLQLINEYNMLISRELETFGNDITPPPLILNSVPPVTYTDNTPVQSATSVDTSLYAPRIAENSKFGEHKSVIYDEAQVLELNEGQIQRVMGPNFAEIDTYPLRMRMPSPPFLFVSRVTELTVQEDVFAPFSLEWEYDIPEGAWYMTEGRIPTFVVIESSHAIILGFMVMGCDKLFKGRLSYRILDFHINIKDMMRFKAGDTFRCRLTITSLIKSNNVVLIHHETKGYHGDELIFEAVSTSGFFSVDDIRNSKGLNRTPYFKALTEKKTPFKPIIHCEKQHFNEQEVTNFMDGKLSGCFGPAFKAGDRNFSLFSPKVRVISRVINVDPNGGDFGLGVILAQQDVDPSHWIFKCHFKGDGVFPGSLMYEGIEQTNLFYLCYLGLASTPYLKPCMRANVESRAKFRGEVRAAVCKIDYRLTCKSVDVKYEDDGETIREITSVLIGEVIYQGEVVAMFEPLELMFISEKALIGRDDLIVLDEKG